MPRAAPLELDAKSQFFRSRATTRSWFSARWLSINSSRPSSTNLQGGQLIGQIAERIAPPGFGSRVWASASRSAAISESSGIDCAWRRSRLASAKASPLRAPRHRAAGSTWPSARAHRGQRFDEAAVRVGRTANFPKPASRIVSYPVQAAAWRSDANDTRNASASSRSCVGVASSAPPPAASDRASRRRLRGAASLARENLCPESRLPWRR